MSRINVLLRSQQMDYLEYLAERDDTSIGKALGDLIEQHAPPEITTRPQGRMVTLHIWVRDDRLAVLDRLVAHWGLSRSDITRRIIDVAAEIDPRRGLMRSVR